MISYNSGSREMCLKIKAFLEYHGHRVWIDVENIGGSSLEAMANALENSKAVLMCMSEKYKQSANCRAEAEYAFQLGKPIIPLIMQKGYRADGWLGIILGSKIFVDFQKYELQECFRRLSKELNLYCDTKKATVREEAVVCSKPTATEQPQPTTTTSTAASIKTSKEQPAVLKWSPKKVETWLTEKRIHEVIIQNIVPCSGKILAQLYEMQSQCPSFFYGSITSNQQVPTSQVATFAFELKSLFE